MTNRAATRGLCTLLGAGAVGFPILASRAAEAPGAAAGTYRVTLERITQNHQLQVEFPPTGGARPVTGQQSLYFWFNIATPSPAAALGIAGFAGPARAVTDAGVDIPLTHYNADGQRQTEGKLWRGYLVLPQTDPHVASLREIAGEFQVYPRAREAKLDWTLPAQLPATKELDGYKVTLQSVKRTGEEARIVLQAEWPKSASITRLHADQPWGISAYSPASGFLQLQRTIPRQVTNTPQRVVWEYTMDYGNVKGAVERVSVQSLVRSGTPRLVPFRLTRVALPNAVAAQQPAEPAAPAPTVADFPFLVVAKGGSLAGAVTRSGAPVGVGELRLGLSRREGDGWTAWRWLALKTDAQGRWALDALKPGQYRVRRRWAPLAADPEGARLAAALKAGRWTNSAAEITVGEGQRETLPNLDWQPGAAR